MKVDKAGHKQVELNEWQPFINKLDATKNLKYVTYLYICVICLLS